MSSIATEAPSVKAAPKRLLRWLAKTGPLSGVLQITMVRSKARSEVFRYFVRPIEGADFGPAFLMEKVEHGEDGKPTGRVEESYDVNLHDFGSCTCLGHSRWGKCKHLDAMRAVSAS